VERQPVIQSPTLRTQTITIPGRSGSLTVSEDAYDTYTKTCECLLKTTDFLPAIAPWLKGNGDVIFSNERQFRQEALIRNKIDLNKAFKMGFRRFLLQFECQPFKYEINPKPITITAPTTLKGNGNYYSEPIIRVNGAGNITITINGKSFNLYTIADYVIVNTKIILAYRTLTQLMNNQMSGDFPTLLPKENVISWTGNVSSLIIEPNWRWI